MAYSNPHLMTVFVAYCTPHLAVNYNSTTSTCLDVTDTSEADTMTFRSLHRLDMKFIQIDSNGEFHLGFDRRTIFGKSWYEMIHPEDVDEAQRKHMELTRAFHAGDVTSSQTMCTRVQTANGRFLWLHVVMRLHGNSSDDNRLGELASQQPVIICTNHVIDEMAALFLRVQELEAPVAAESQAHQLTPSTAARGDCFFDVVGLPGVDAAAAQNFLAPRTSAQPGDGRLDVNQRIKRKICERQLHQTDGVGRTKIPRLDDLIPLTGPADAEAILMSLPSMPSPPMQQWDYGAMQFGTSSFDGSSTGCVAAPLENVFDFQPGLAVQAANAEHPISDSILTPASSPIQFNNSSQMADAEMLDIDLDLVTELEDDSSFFGPSDHGLATVGAQKAAVLQFAGDSRWSTVATASTLPELDHVSIASILGDSELPTPTSAVAPSVSGFSMSTESRRQQMSGGRVIVVGDVDKADDFGQLGAATAAASIDQSHLQAQVNEQLIRELLTLGGNFIQNLSLDAEEWPYSHQAFHPTIANQFQLGDMTSVFV